MSEGGTERFDRHGYGRFTTELKDTSFGLLIDHDHDDRVMLMGLPRMAGWRAISSVCLPHQTYAEKAEEWLKGKEQARKIAVLEVDSGEWQTVWEGGWTDGIRADWLPNNAVGCVECRRPVPSGRLSDVPCSACKADSSQLEDGDGHPTCDHRDHDEPVPAVAQFEGCHPTGAPTFRYWACADHAPEGPAIKQVDPGPDERFVQPGTDGDEEVDRDA